MLMETAQNITTSMPSFEIRIEEQKDGPRILIVEDDELLKVLWSYIIHQADHNAQISWASTEPEGEKLLQQSFKNGEEYDLVISDIFLSGSKTGIELWSQFHEKLEGKMIMTSGIDYSKYVKQLKFTHIPYTPLYLQKPLEMDDCINIVQYVLHKNEA